MADNTNQLLERVVTQLAAASQNMSSLITTITDLESLADIVTQLEDSNANMLDLITAVGDISVPQTIAPTSVTVNWKGDTSDPAIGNGTLSCEAMLSGGFIIASIYLLIGSTTTFGTGNWYFQLFSFPYDQVATMEAQGSAWGLDSGTALWAGTTFAADGTNKIYVAVNGAANFINSTVPFTWAAGDYLRLSIRIPYI